MHRCSDTKLKIFRLSFPVVVCASEPSPLDHTAIRFTVDGEIGIVPTLYYDGETSPGWGPEARNNASRRNVLCHAAKCKAGDSERKQKFGLTNAFFKSGVDTLPSLWRRIVDFIVNNFAG
ncbi:hypothetical protein TcWFU_009691 [Taenia crassiceps]|uniref:Uncharacterized protein n=1 Tax=Taenia crassiceps TaxID=6207 RepID=A0ABR4Q5X8_9CEST